MIEQDKFHHTEVHCTPANTNDRENGRLIDVTYIKDLDKHWLDVSLAFMDKMKAVGSHSSCTTQHAAVIVLDQRRRNRAAFSSGNLDFVTSRSFGKLNRRQGDSRSPVCQQAERWSGVTA
jgi:hypothetical protein